MEYHLTPDSTVSTGLLKPTDDKVVLCAWPPGLLSFEQVLLGEAMLPDVLWLFSARGQPDDNPSVAMGTWP